MTSWQVRRVRAAWQFGFALVLVGFVPVLLLVLQSFLPLAGARDVVRPITEFPAAWLPLHKVAWLPPQLHGSLALAVLGFAVMTLGAGIARRQSAILQAAQRETQDRLRRVSQYDDIDRIEPYIGSTITVIDEADERPVVERRRFW